MKIEEIHISTPDKTIDAQDFDIEKWRREMPIDYYKLAKLLICAEHPLVKAELFRTIYQAIQLHIPDTLYKYVSLSAKESSNEKRFDSLLKRRLYLAEVSTLNDPFDCKAYYYNADALTKYDALKPYNGRIIDDFSSLLRVVSLTANGVQSLPMWAHYANNHEGFCVSYDMTDKCNNLLRSCTFPVFYTNDRIDITSVMDSFVMILQNELKTQSAAGKKEILIDDLTVVLLASLLCNVKQRSWSYENEYRCTEGATAPGLPYVYAKAKGIYIGMKCKEDHAKRLQEIGKTMNIPVFKMEFEEMSENYSLSAAKVSD